jgi:hypothetical protein
MDALFGIFEAWNALAALFAGTLCAGIGLAIAVYLARVRLYGRVYAAEIVAVRAQAEQKQKMYWPVVAFDAAGVRREIAANSGSNSLLANAPGTKLTVIADPATPDSVLLARDWWVLCVVAVFCAGCGAPFIAMGLEHLRFNMRTVMVALVGFGVIASMAVPIVRPFFDGSGDMLAKARQAFRAKQAGRRELATMSEREIAEALATQRRQARIAAPLIVLVGAVSLGGGVYWYQNDSAFIASAVSAQGTVLRNDVDTGGETPMYHAVVEFTDAGGNVVTHRDTTGHSDPSFEPGEKVTVLYAPTDSNRAMIDRGRWNLLWPMLVVAAGLLLIAAGVRTHTLARG